MFISNSLIQGSYRASDEKLLIVSIL
jgi:hypothetical protein